MNNAKRREILEITVGVVLLSLGFYFFLLPLGLVIGGVMGVSVLIQDIIPVSLFMYIANIILLIIGGIFLGKVFFYKTVYATLLSPTLVLILEKTIDSNFFMRHMVESPLLIGATFGGLFIGAGLGIVVRNNGTTGGIDVVQRILNKFLNIPFSTAMYFTDGAVIFVAMLINFQLGLYAVGSMIIIGIIVDKLAIEGKAGYTVFIVSTNSEELQKQIYEKIDRGITKVKVVGGYTKQDKELIICTVDRRELYQFKILIKETDPHAFTFVTKTQEALGQGFSREGAKW
ncbi:MAG: YitT family protein [Acholeplasmataceae bacterium]|nr:YitT family protein [Acholeplasmataceae bacterium]